LHEFEEIRKRLREFEVSFRNLRSKKTKGGDWGVKVTVNSMEKKEFGLCTYKHAATGSKNTVNYCTCCFFQN
jgi:hypothetical protein